MLGRRFFKIAYCAALSLEAALAAEAAVLSAAEEIEALCAALCAVLAALVESQIPACTMQSCTPARMALLVMVAPDTPSTPMLVPAATTLWQTAGPASWP